MGLEEEEFKNNNKMMMTEVYDDVSSAPADDNDSASTMSEESESNSENQEVKQFSCEFCPKKFNLQRTYERHVVEKHKIKTYRCKVCLQEFNNRQVLKEHCEQSHQEDRVPCHLCKKTFTTKSSLRLHHEAIHRGIRYKCDHCDKSFGQLGSLRRHVNTIHNGASISEPQLVVSTERFVPLDSVHKDEWVSSPDKLLSRKQSVESTIGVKRERADNNNSQLISSILQQGTTASAGNLLSGMTKRVRTDIPNLFSAMLGENEDNENENISSSANSQNISNYDKSAAVAAALKPNLELYNKYEVGPSECAAIAILVSMKA